MGEKLYGEVIQQDNLTIKREKCVTRKETKNNIQVNNTFRIIV